jgi:hypothetical protein
MAYKPLPTKSSDLITELIKRYPDQIEEFDMAPFERGKQTGVVILLRELKYRLDKEI